MVNYYSIKEPIIHEIDIKKSRFITYLYPIQTENDFNEHLAAIRKEHYKATHHCQAFILNEDSSIQRMSDDGEPSGTAGVPMLEVLKRNNLTYIMAVTVRYFGGTKLGAGGLIRAYSTAVSETLNHATLIANATQMVIELTLDYSQIDTFNYYLQQTDIPITVMDTQYTDKVSQTLALYLNDIDQVHNDLTEQFSGQVDWVEMGEQTVDVPVISTQTD
ncbi:YigZ family protein [Aerococcaceae bacterium DSM 111021]|nr:YigZ family protein [Aerococcaceae bacterium DSM 111021]